MSGYYYCPAINSPGDRIARTSLLTGGILYVLVLEYFEIQLSSVILMCDF